MGILFGLSMRGRGSVQAMIGYIHASVTQDTIVLLGTTSAMDVLTGPFMS
jgi:hypothetical protein